MQNCGNCQYKNTERGKEPCKTCLSAWNRLGYPTKFEQQKDKWYS